MMEYELIRRRADAMARQVDDGKIEDVKTRGRKDRREGALADCKSAIRQATSLRYLGVCRIRLPSETTAICDGHRPPLHQKGAIAGRKAGRVPHNPA
jgi:hypothetical protein